MQSIIVSGSSPGITGSLAGCFKLLIANAWQLVRPRSNRRMRAVCQESRAPHARR